MLPSFTGVLVAAVCAAANAVLVTRAVLQPADKFLQIRLFVSFVKLNCLVLITRHELSTKRVYVAVSR